jgi:hypothetical protein
MSDELGDRSELRIPLLVGVRAGLGLISRVCRSGYDDQKQNSPEFKPRAVCM